MKRLEVNVSLLHELLSYDTVSGFLFWKKRLPKHFTESARRTSDANAKWWNGRFAGRRACQSDFSHGYLRVGIFKTNYPAHRVVWAMCHGKWPTNSIDHINGKMDDNRIENLREATAAQNNRNRAAHGRSRFRGVSWRTRQKCWVAAIKTDGKVTFLGLFQDEEKAARAYDIAAMQQHGDFARLNFP
jgi:hypothetical protein